MARTARLINTGEPTVYHLMSRTALDGFPFGDVEKEYMVKTLKLFSSLYFVDMLGYSVMDNHVHIVIRMHTRDYLDDPALIKRLADYYGDDRNLTDTQLPAIRQKLSDVSWFMKDIKQHFTRFYNRRHNRTGYFWGGRFKSVIVEEGETLVNLLAYVDLNAIRAGIVKRPEDYRWCSLGWHMQTGNKDNWLSSDFGANLWEKLSRAERLRYYREYVYEAGAIGGKGVIDPDIVHKERKKEYAPTRTDYLLHRSRWFIDSGVIGSKARMHTADHCTDADIKKRYAEFYRDEKKLCDSQPPALRQKLSDISVFMQELKQQYTRFYNKKHNRRGFFWGGRFKSVIVEKGETLINLLAYVDLNPVRAGIVEQPEAYR